MASATKSMPRPGKETSIQRPPSGTTTLPPRTRAALTASPHLQPPATATRATRVPILPSCPRWPHFGHISHHVRSPPACLCPELLICLQAALQLSSLLHQESTEACVVPILDEATRLKHPAEDEDLPELEKARTKTTKAAKPRCTNTQHLHVLFAKLHVSPQDPGAFMPLRALPKGLYRRKTIHSGKSISEY